MDEKLFTPEWTYAKVPQANVQLFLLFSRPDITKLRLNVTFSKFYHANNPCIINLTKQVIPSSVPTSQGYKFNTFVSSQEQFRRHNSRLDTPTIQSGDGSILETIDIRWCLLSSLKTANVLPVTFGQLMPLALMIVRMFAL